MRHRKKGKILDRKKASRVALIRQLAESLILHEKIVTTEAKAKALRPIIEKLVTRARGKEKLAVRRTLLSKLPKQKAVKKLQEDIAPRYKERKGGYTRIIKLGALRQGDGAKMAQIEFV